uniref:Monocarboxylate transporter n=1 Tax=Macrostomum lignano TaxID=282301 RepID=A0A1I8FK60_9PLAT
LGSFLHILVIGNVRSTGLLLASVSEHYNRSKRDTSWILRASSPVTMALARRFSVRLVVSIGSCFLGLAPDGRYMGITFSGCSMGALCMPPLMNYLIEQYTFRGCMLIWGAIMLNVAVAAAVMRPFVPASDQGAAPEAEALIGEEAENAEKNAEKSAEKNAEKSAEKECGEDQEQSKPSKAKTNGDPHHYCTSADNILFVSGSAKSAAGRAAVDVELPRRTPRPQSSGRCVPRRPGPARPAIFLASCGDVSVLFDSGGGPANTRKTSFRETSSPDSAGASKRAAGRLMRRPRFWVLLFSLSLAAQAMPFNFMVLPQHGKNIGMTATEYTPAAAAAVQAQLLLLTLTIAQGALWCLLLHPTPAAALAYALLEGLLAGGLVPNLAPMLVETADLFEPDRLLEPSISFLSGSDRDSRRLLAASARMNLVQQRLERRRRQQSAKPAP